MPKMPVGKSDQKSRLKYWKDEVKRLSEIAFRTPAQETRLAIAVSYALVMESYLKEAEGGDKQEGLL